MLVRDRPAVAFLAQPHRQAQAQVWLLRQLVLCSATQQRGRERGAVAGGHIEPDDLEYARSPERVEKGRPGLAIGVDPLDVFGGGTSNISMSGA